MHHTLPFYMPFIGLMALCVSVLSGWATGLTERYFALSRLGVPAFFAILLLGFCLTGLQSDHPGLGTNILALLYGIALLFWSTVLPLLAKK